MGIVVAGHAFRGRELEFSFRHFIAVVRRREVAGSARDGEMRLLQGEAGPVVLLDSVIRGNETLHGMAVFATLGFRGSRELARMEIGVAIIAALEPRQDP